MIAVAILPVFYFFFLKLNLFPVLHLCSVLPFCRLSVVRLCKVRGVIFEAILSPSERYQNIQDNPEYNSVWPFRIILKIFAVNMLQMSQDKLSQAQEAIRKIVALWHCPFNSAKRGPNDLKFSIKLDRVEGFMRYLMFNNFWLTALTISSITPPNIKNIILKIKDYTVMCALCARVTRP